MCTERKCPYKRVSREEADECYSSSSMESEVEGGGKELEEDPGKENNVRHLLVFR